MHDAHLKPRPLGGRILTVPVAILTVLTLVGFYYIAQRYYLGIGAVANVNPGYPWGIWVAFDVIVGPAIGCGGFAMALLTYVLNQGKYHPIMRPALLGGLFGYTLAGVAVLIDLGRYFNSLNLMLPWYLNTNSIMLETALCVMAYVAVLWIEFSPAFLERFGLGRIRLFLERFMFVIIALGVLLPTMHQSALGTILAVNESKLSPLWWTQLLPLLYLLSAVAMGFSIVAFEATLVSRGFRLQSELPLLASIARVTLWLTVVFMVIRIGAIALAGDLGLAFRTDPRSVLVLAGDRVVRRCGGPAVERPLATHRTLHFPWRLRAASRRRHVPPRQLSDRLQGLARVEIFPVGSRTDDHGRAREPACPAVHPVLQIAAGPLHSAPPCR